MKGRQTKMAEFEPLAGKICLVTGATRGMGKGIALQMSQAGATAYITAKIYYDLSLSIIEIEIYMLKD